MAFTTNDFSKIWASTSPLTPYEFSDSNYQQGWNFIGATPPARQMWDFLQKRNDEKAQWLYNNKLSLSGGTMTGNLATTNSEFLRRATNDSYLRFMGGVSATEGASLVCFGKDNSAQPGEFTLCARDSSNVKDLNGKPDGTLTWGGKNVERVNAIGSDYIRYESGLQVCWGAIGNVTTDGKAVTFPVAFNSSPTVLSTGSGNYIAWASSVTTTTCNVRISSGTNTVKYLAIGSWK